MTEDALWRIGDDAVGPLHMGMTEQQVADVLGDPVNSRVCTKPGKHPVVTEHLFGPPTGVTTYYHWGHLVQVNISLFTGPQVTIGQTELRGLKVLHWQTDDVLILPSGAALVGSRFVLVPPRTNAEWQDAEKLGWRVDPGDILNAPAASVRVLSFLTGLELASFSTHRWGEPGDGYQNSDL